MFDDWTWDRWFAAATAISTVVLALSAIWPHWLLRRFFPPKVALNVQIGVEVAEPRIFTHAELLVHNFEPMQIKVTEIRAVKPRHMTVGVQRVVEARTSYEAPYPTTRVYKPGDVRVNANHMGGVPIYLGVSGDKPYSGEVILDVEVKREGPVIQSSVIRVRRSLTISDRSRNPSASRAAE